MIERLREVGGANQIKRDNSGQGGHRRVTVPFQEDEKKVAPNRPHPCQRAAWSKYFHPRTAWIISTASKDQSRHDSEWDKFNGYRHVVDLSPDLRMS